MEYFLLKTELEFLRQIFPAKIKGVFSFDRTDISFLLGNKEKTYLSFKLDSNHPSMFCGKYNRNRSTDNSNIKKLHNILLGFKITNIHHEKEERYFYLKLEKDNKYRLFVSLIPQKLNMILLNASEEILWSNSYRSMDGNNMPILEGINFDEALFLQKKSQNIRESMISRSYRNLLDDIQIDNIEKLINNDLLIDSNFYVHLKKFNTNEEIRPYILPFEIKDMEILYKGNINECLSEAYNSYFQLNHLIKSYRSKLKNLRKELSKYEKKLNIQEKEYKTASEHTRYMLYGELLKANLNNIKSKADSIVLKDFEGLEHRIPLDEKLTILQNMKNYFNFAKRMRRGIDIKKQNIDRTIIEINTLKDSIKELESIDSYEKLKESINIETHRPNKKHLRSKDPKMANIREYKTKEGYTILVANNSKANDNLTVHIAKPDDIWLHTQNIPGSHIIIKNPGKNKTVPLEVLLQGAKLAVRNSKAKNSTKVPVDYTKRKYVKKPRKSPPGFVIYTNQKTLIIDGD